MGFLRLGIWMGMSMVELRVNEFLEGRHHLAPAELSGAFLEDLRGFCGGRALTDDLTLMVVRREA